MKNKRRNIFFHKIANSSLMLGNKHQACSQMIVKSTFPTPKRQLTTYIGIWNLEHNPNASSL